MKSYKKIEKESVSALVRVNKENKNLVHIVVFIKDINNPNNIDNKLAQIGLGINPETNKVDMLQAYIYRLFEGDIPTEAVVFALADQGEYDSVESHYIPNVDKYNPGDSNTYTMFDINNNDELNRFVTKAEFENVKRIQQLMTRTIDEIKQIVPYIVNNYSFN